VIERNERRSDVASALQGLGGSVARPLPPVPPDPNGPSESLGRDERLRRRAEFLRVYAEGRRIVGRLVVGFEAPSQAGRTRLGVTVTRKAGKAVERNRIRRRVKEAFRRSVDRPPASAAVDLVFNVRDGVAEASFEALAEDLGKVLRRLAKGRP